MWNLMDGEKTRQQNVLLLLRRQQRRMHGLQQVQGG
jgi:hypothetical protein